MRGGKWMSGIKSKRERKRERFVWELENTEMLNITFCHMFQIGLLLQLDKQAAFKNHFCFHHVLIRANLLCLFGNGKSRSKQK